MHLTPDQIDRQPFRMRKRGYDIMQVRNFLREIAQEMRERQLVREELVRSGDPEAVGADRALVIVGDAEERAARIIAEAETSVDFGDVPGARLHADEIVAQAEAEAERILDRAEASARQRSAEVLAETQARLDALLEEERAVTERLREARATPSADVETAVADVVPAAEEARPDSSSLAEFMKSTLRQEL